MRHFEEGWTTVALLAALMTVATWSVAAAGWADGLWAAWPTVLVAVGAGFALAKSRFTGWQAAGIAAIYGLFVVGVFICLTVLNGDAHQRSVELVVRINNFLYKLLHGGTNRDALPFPVSLALIFWVLGVTAAWNVFRQGQAWSAVIPSGMAALINAYYYLGPVQLDLYLAVYVLLALLLVARMSLLGREREWVAARVAYSPEMRFDFLRAGLAVALVSIFVGWAGPSLAASQTAATAWREVSGPLAVVRESWMRLFSAIRSRGQTVNDFYGDSLALGGPATLTNAPIMDVALEVDETQAGAVGAAPVARYYWRALAHDTYVDGRWTSENIEFKEFDPARATAMRLPAYLLRKDVRFSFTSFVGASSRLYTAQQTKWVDRLATFGIAPTPGGAFDINTLLVRDILRSGGTYRIIASLSIADVESLREAGQDYPAWVTERYLQVPDTVTPRTRALAQQIVAEAGARTPYDQAQAITDWLRANIQYDQQIEAPPPEAEPIDYLLFSSRTGYCNYYATAEVILLRSLGIPARFTVGFAQGEYDDTTGVYHVVEHDAHAWPEVFFPGLGWVEFEPTASEPALIRPERKEASAQPEPGGTPPPTPDPSDPTGGREVGDDEDPIASSTPFQIGLIRAGRFLQQALLVSLVVGAVLGVLILAGIQFGVLGWENLGALGRWVLRARKRLIPSAIRLAYLNLERATRWLGLNLTQALTPHERGEAVSVVIPQARAEVELITTHYATESYSPRPFEADAQIARGSWARIRWRVWVAVVRGFARSWTDDQADKRKARAIKK